LSVSGRPVGVNEPTGGDGVKRELAAEAVCLQAEALRAYLAKPRNLGVSFWLRGKGFSEPDCKAVLAALRAGARP
jgi:hypothetical protein